MLCGTGAAQIAGVFYLLGNDQTDLKIYLYFSTDGITWSIADQANSPDVDFFSGPDWCLTQCGIKLAATWQNGLEAGNRVAIFDTSTGLWESNTLLTESNAISFVVYNAITGNLVIVGGFAPTFMFFNVAAKTNTVPAPCGFVPIDGLCEPIGLIQAGNLTHVSFLQSDGITDQLGTAQTIAGDGTLGSYQTLVDCGPGTAAAPFASYVTPALNGTQVFVGFPSTDGVNYSIVICSATSATNPAWSNESVQVANIPFSASLVFNTNLYLLISTNDNIGDNPFTVFTKTSGVWDAGVLIGLLDFEEIFAIPSSLTYTCAIKGSMYSWSGFGTPIPPVPSSSIGIINPLYPIVLPNPASFCIGDKLTHCMKVKCCRGVMLKTKEIIIP